MNKMLRGWCGTSLVCPRDVMHSVRSMCAVRLPRDLTPNNILVQPQTLEAKLTDFGLARQKVSTATHAASMMKSMVGTILYSCPEIVQSSNYSNKADVWSLGCVLYKMATLRDPFQGNNPLVVARNIVECTYSRLEAGPRCVLHDTVSCFRHKKHFDRLHQTT